MIGNPRIVLVYLGETLPRYAVENVRYLRRTFSEHEVWLVCDSDAVAHKAARLGAQVWRYRVDEVLRKRLLTVIGFDPEFRNGFWISAMVRLWAVAAFARAHSDAPVVHLEADVWLAPDAPIARWMQIDCAVAFPLVSSDAAAASVLLVNDAAVLEQILGEIDRAPGRGGTTDMTLLAWAQGRSDVCILPTAPNATACFHAATPGDLRQRMSAALEVAGGIIDAATWGQFILGLDAKNARGRRWLFKDLPEHAIDCRSVQLKVDTRGAITITGEFGEVSVFALHVHSKDARMFRNASPLLRKRAEQLQHGPRVEFDTRAFASAIVEAVRRRIRMVSKRLSQPAS